MFEDFTWTEQTFSWNDICVAKLICLVNFIVCLFISRFQSITLKTIFSRTIIEKSRLFQPIVESGESTFSVEQPAKYKYSRSNQKWNWPPLVYREAFQIYFIKIVSFLIILLIIHCILYLRLVQVGHEQCRQVELPNQVLCEW